MKNSEYDALISKLAQVRDELFEYEHMVESGMINGPECVIYEMVSEIKRLREALAFYADEAMYEKKLVSKSMCPQIEPDEYAPAYIPHFDKGYKARETLEGGVNNGKI